MNPTPTVTPCQEFGGVGLTPAKAAGEDQLVGPPQVFLGEKGAKTTARKRISRKTITTIPWAAACQPSW